MDYESCFNYRITSAANDLGIDLLSSNELQITSETPTLMVSQNQRGKLLPIGVLCLLKDGKKKRVMKQAGGLLPRRCAFHGGDVPQRQTRSGEEETL